MSHQKLSVRIITRNPIFREGLASILPQDRFEIFPRSISINGSDPSDEDPILDLILVVDLHSAPAKADEIATLHWKWPSARIIILSDQHNRYGIAAAFQAGANAWVDQPSSHDTLLNIIDLVLTGETILISAQLDKLFSPDDGTLQSVTPPAPAHPHSTELALRNSHVRDASAIGTTVESDVPTLSDREKLIAAMLVAGHSNKLIARHIRVSEATVKVHIKSILRKIRVSNRTQAAIWASKNGITALEKCA